jgi:hypothetical protein
MKRVARLWIVLALMAAPIASHGGEDLSGVWTLRIRNLGHQQMSVATVRFSDDAAYSCMAGNWKRVVVESIETKDSGFFPLSEPLSYTLEGSEITIGRNDVCDGYLHLRGKFDGGKASGSYTAFGITGGEQLGEFALGRSP